MASAGKMLCLHLDPKVPVPSGVSKDAERWEAKDQNKLAGVSERHFGAVLVTTPKPFSGQYMAQLLRAMEPGSKIEFHTSGDAGTVEGIEKSLLFGGFVEVKTSGGAVSGSKPAYKVGAARKFKKKKTATQAKDAEAKAKEEKSSEKKSEKSSEKKSVWALGDDDLAEDDLVDEDEYEITKEKNGIEGKMKELWKEFERNMNVTTTTSINMHIT
uniref:Uncharacterized protein n=1 Tax=Lotharella globosa TaxID=91324 RepID=A0A7S3YNI9_9EUKA